MAVSKKYQMLLCFKNMFVLVSSHLLGPYIFITSFIVYFSLAFPNKGKKDLA